MNCVHCPKLIFELFYIHLFRVVIIFIMIKIFFYICWYRSRQRQLAAYLSNPRNAQIVIVGGRAYLHQMCERQNVSILQLHLEITLHCCIAFTGPSQTERKYQSWHDTSFFSDIDTDTETLNISRYQYRFQEGFFFFYKNCFSFEISYFKFKYLPSNTPYADCLNNSGRYRKTKCNKFIVFFFFFFFFFFFLL